MAALYIFWLLINLALGIGFVVAWYRCLRLFAQRYSRVASVALCALTLMMCKGNAGSANESVHPATDVRTEFPLTEPAYYGNNLLTLPFAQLDQRISLEPLHQTGDSIRTEQTVLLTGLMTGLRWESKQQIVDQLPNRRVRYTVHGLLHWRLLNLDIYSQSLAYNGVLNSAAQPSR